MWIFRKLTLPALIAFGAVAIFSQGGKAEPKRMVFIPERRSANATGRLRISQEMDFVFSVNKGRKVIVRNPNSSAFDFRIFDPKSGFDTEFDSSPMLELEIEADGEYLLIVRRKVGRGPRIAKFSITLTIN